MFATQEVCSKSVIYFRYATLEMSFPYRQ